MYFDAPIQKAGAWFKRYATLLEKLDIKTLGNLLYHIPFRYEDYSLVSTIANMQPGEVVTVRGTIIDIQNEYTRSSLRLQKATIADDTGNIDVTWFNQPFLPKIMKKGDRVSLSGKVTTFGVKKILESPEYEIVTTGNTTIHTGRLVPIYPETKGISSKWIRRQIYRLLNETFVNGIEFLPSTIRKKHNLSELKKALQDIHFPLSLEDAQRARERLSFDELFLLQLTAIEKRDIWKKQLKSSPFAVATFTKDMDAFISKLPFTLTNAQKKAVEDIYADLSLEKPMNRLLEGDVGSGKTVVGAIAIYLAHLNGYQSVLMAPTEILAEQHYKTLSKLLSPLGVKVELRTSSHKGKETKNLHPSPLTLNADILVGTHAVLSEKIHFENLGLVVIDEQQRFGVAQRAMIRKKGKSPHVLTMTATPIPRTIALTLYGDLDLSFLDEMPRGRKIIKTWLIPLEKRQGAYEWIQKQVTQTKSQAFIICPFIEESENMQTVRAATKEFKRLQKEIFPDLKLGLLHGRLSAKEKDAVLEDFRKEKTDILVATPVVEVGIDITNATIMLIETAERFGLAQLHQLRGRVGRGSKQSYCLLFTESKSETTTQRLKAMETRFIGRELAELDLALRGPGEMYGTKQHGTHMLKIASFADVSLIEKARKEAQEVFINISKYPMISRKLKKMGTEHISPD